MSPHARSPTRTAQRPEPAAAVERITRSASHARIGPTRTPAQSGGTGACRRGPGGGQGRRIVGPAAPGGAPEAVFLVAGHGSRGGPIARRRTVQPSGGGGGRARV